MRLTRWTGMAVLAVSIAAAGCDTVPSAVSLDAPVAESGDVVERRVPSLSEPEIRIYLGDSTLSHAGENRVWHVYFAPDGRLEGLSRTEDKAVERARGSWRVTSAGQLCQEWENDWGGGTDSCAEVYRFGSTYILVQPGGDPEGDGALRRSRSAGNIFAREG